MGYSFGKASRAELSHAHGDLRRVFERAIAISEQDFGAHDVIRTKAEQAEMVRRGASQTMESKHRGDLYPDGKSRAVDAVPWINGKYRWEWEPIYKIAKAVQQAAKELGVRIRWGGAWDRVLNDIGDPKREVEAYVARRKAQKKKAFIDGPHFELA